MSDLVARLVAAVPKTAFLLASLKRAYKKKGDLRPDRAGAKRNPFCFTVACRSVLAGRPGQRRCQPTMSGEKPTSSLDKSLALHIRC